MSGYSKFDPKHLEAAGWTLYRDDNGEVVGHEPPDLRHELSDAVQAYFDADGGYADHHPDVLIAGLDFMVRELLAVAQLQAETS